MNGLRVLRLKKLFFMGSDLKAKGRRMAYLPHDPFFQSRTFAFQIFHYFYSYSDKLFNIK